MVKGDSLKLKNCWYKGIIDFCYFKIFEVFEMSDKNKTQITHDFQDAGVKKAKRIASVIYILVLTFIVGGSWLHQQQQASEETDELEVVEFNTQP